MEPVAEHRRLCAICREPLGHIMFGDDPNSHKTSPLDWPLRGVSASVGMETVHVLGEKIHYGQVIEDSGLVLGTPRIGELEDFAILEKPIEALRYKGL